MYNFKNKEGQKVFKQITSETSELSQCFETDAPLDEQISNWQNVLKSSCSKAFKKISIQEDKDKKKEFYSNEN